MAHPAFLPRPSDIYIATYPRSGTSLVQMMLHQLGSEGEMNFGHMDDIIPFFEKGLRNQRDLECLPSPRIFKTHLPYRTVSSRPGRYIYVVRRGKDVLLSYFHLYKAYVDSSVTFESFFEAFLSGNVQYGSWFRHVTDWCEHRYDPRILFLQYEDIIQDLGQALESVSRFLGWRTSDEQRERAMKRCGITFMRQHERQFAPVLQFSGMAAQRGQFIRQGKAGAGIEQLSREQQERFDRVAATHFANHGITVVRSFGWTLD